MIGKKLKDAMEEWDQEDVARFVSIRTIYTESDIERDILSEKINILAGLVDQKFDLLLKDNSIEKMDKKIQRCKEASTSLRPKGIIFKRCPKCNGKLELKRDSIRCEGDVWGNYRPGLYCYYYTCLNCGYVHGRLK